MAASKNGGVALTLLSQAHTADFAATYYRDKVVQRPLYLKPTPKDPSEPSARDLRRRVREEKKAHKQKLSGKPKPLSAKRKRALQIYAIPKSQQKYDIYAPMHKLWCGYMHEILGLNRPDSSQAHYIDPKNAGPLLASADFHGAFVQVVSSRCVGRVGVRGIVVRDTKSTFEIITPNNKLKTIPKEHTVFRLEIPLSLERESTDSAVAAENQTAGSKPFVIELYGSSLEHRAPDRATRKFVFHLPDL
ncbi:uncharacterized protein PV09_08019 [Verruconis gallopava]|uniref:Ribonuclease P protein subunit n=1 Tax=Verruconis gallopava TaxID=253628 RepID=A0A0D2AN25_9PEZI|nr:uncharacterized protein PV09_08019 [Verruconis gallopava]KIW00499.1 hypothetical protein PV09_08019 [Verruconis gallopava]